MSCFTVRDYTFFEKHTKLKNIEERGSPSHTCDQPRGPEPRTDQLWVKDCALSARVEAEREQTWAKL